MRIEIKACGNVLDISKGRALVGTARRALDLWVTERKKLAEKGLEQRSGLFVTLETYPEKELRGCIGFPYPEKPLTQAAIEAAIYASKDPRFEPVAKEELGGIIVELTVLTEPELLKTKPEHYAHSIEIGRHGLIIDNGVTSGLLLPQVAAEYGWKPRQFLEETCWKAGLTPDAWLDPRAKLYVFEGQVFAEREPRGEAEEKKMA